MSANQDLGHLTDFSDGIERGFRNVELMQAGHAATIDADEMRMRAIGWMRFVSYFEPPDVIA